MDVDILANSLSTLSIEYPKRDVHRVVDSMTNSQIDRVLEALAVLQLYNCKGSMNIKYHNSCSRLMLMLMDKKRC